MKYRISMTLLAAILICLIPFAGSLQANASADPNTNNNAASTISVVFSEAMNPSSTMAADLTVMYRVVPAAAFYGTITLNDNPAPKGTTIEVRGTGVLTGVQGNPISVIETGLYGTAKPVATNLLAMGDIADGTVLSFYVNGVRAAQTAAWHAGLLSELNLTATTSSGGGGGGGGSIPTLKPTATPSAVPSPSPAPTSTPISSTVFTTIATPTVPVTTLPVSTSSPAIQPSPSPAPTTIPASIAAQAMSTPSVQSAIPPSIPPEQPISANRWPLVLGIIAAAVAVMPAIYFAWLKKRFIKH